MDNSGEQEASWLALKRRLEERPVCATCKHWQQPYEGWGLCEQGQNTMWRIVGCYYPDHQDFHEWHTIPDYGCILHELKEK